MDRDWENEQLGREPQRDAVGNHVRSVIAQQQDVRIAVEDRRLAHESLPGVDVSTFGHAPITRASIRDTTSRDGSPESRKRHARVRRPGDRARNRARPNPTYA